MDIDSGTVTIALAVIVPAATAIASYAALRERVTRHDRSVEDIGKRVGAEEAETKAFKAEILELHRRLDAQETRELSRPYGVDPAAPRRGGGE